MDEVRGEKPGEGQETEENHLNPAVSRKSVTHPANVFLTLKANHMS
jgi:hypothetical protein